MNFSFSTALLVPAAMLLLAGCGEDAQPPVDIVATVEARREQTLTAVPTPTATATQAPPRATATQVPPATPGSRRSISSGSGSSRGLSSAVCGGGLIAGDGTYLGIISGNKYSSDSIMNKYGSYGSEYSTSSIWNEYGSYGSPYSTYSVFNDYTSTPPQIIKSGAFLGYVTTNFAKHRQIHPYTLRGWLASNCLYD